MTAKKRTISFALPVYNEREGIKTFYTELLKALSSVENKYNFEFVLVNDGSKDGTTEILKGIAERDNRAVVVEFSRNYGHQIAISAGLDFAKGDAVIIMDSDLQDPPRTCLDLIRAWEDGAEVVYAKRRSRKDSLKTRIVRATFYALLSAISDIEIPRDTGDFRLLDRKAVEAMKHYREKDRYMRGISVHIGFKQKEVLFDRDERFAGETHYSWKKLIRFSLDGIMGFSSVPLKIISRAGFVVSLISILGIIWSVAIKFLRPDLAVPGWAFIVVSVFFIGGVQLIMLGIIASYVGRIYTEAQNRPLYLVSNTRNEKK